MMPVFYLDTSTIVKSYHSEQGSEVIDEILESSVYEDQFHTSVLTLLEGISAIQRLACFCQSGMAHFDHREWPTLVAVLACR